MDIYDWAEALKVSRRLRDETATAQEANEKKIYKLRQFKQTRAIAYPEYKEAFDYVDKLYPQAGVKQATVLYTSKAVLNEVGYRGVGGFYDIQSRIIVISNYVSPSNFFDDGIKSEFTIDEVLCHELIHYAANFNRPSSSRCVEEEIAYGKTVNYLRSRGRTDDFIIRKNMMPYLVSIVDKHKLLSEVLVKAYPNQLPDIAAASEATKRALIGGLSKKLEEAILNEAYSIGQRMIELYGNSSVVDTKVADTSRNLIMDDD